MCGIAGFIGYENQSQLANLANLVQKHRGPNQQAVWEDDWLSLAHQRLAIIDLSEKADQPFLKYNYVLIYNGEIYNYQSLKERLIKQNQTSFTSNSDTEVVLEYYHLYKEKCLDFFEGMFAFAIYDKDKKEFFLARDIFGIKPLCYSLENNQFAFASEIKTLLKTSHQHKKQINKKVLLNSVNFSWVGTHETIIEGIWKLPQGHYLKLNQNFEMEIKAYYSLETKTESFPNPVLTLKQQLGKSVQSHLMADVKVGTFLSGGLDSSLITVLAHQSMADINSYTIAFSAEESKVESMSSDIDYARRLAQERQISLTEINPSVNIFSGFSEIVKILDEPIGDPAWLATYLICKKAAEDNCTVLLSGMGADELFFGYRRQQALYFLKYYQKNLIFKNLQTFSKKILTILFRKNKAMQRWIHKFFSISNLPIQDAFVRSMSYYSKEEINRLFTFETEEWMKDIYEEMGKHLVPEKSKDFISQLCEAEINTFLSFHNLYFSDMASMANSIELRVPFLDKNLAELAMKIGGREKYRNGITKYILKKAAEGVLPRSIIYRKKTSFGLPVRVWFANGLMVLAEKVLSKENILKRGYFNYEEIQKMILQQKNGTKDYSYHLFHLIVIELWFQELIDN